MPRKKRSDIPDELIDQLLKDYKDPDDLVGESGILKQLTARLVERALESEMTDHLGYEKHDPAGRGTPNSRNGTSPKTLKTDRGQFEIEVPRDRESSFEPQLVKKRQTRFTGFDEKILGLYARGMTVRDIQGHLEELYGVEVSPDLISKATSAVKEDVIAWQNRPLDPVYPIVYLDALVAKVRDEGVVRNKSIYLALGVGVNGTKEVLGLWIEQTEGAKFWLKVVNELKTRGVQDILVACCDGLKGFPDAISLAARIARVLHKRNRETNLEPDPLTACYATAVQGLLAFGEHAGARAPRIGDAPPQPNAASRHRCATHRGVSLHADARVRAHARSQLERLCRYAARPAIAQHRLSLTPDGQVLYRFKRPHRDGKTHVLLDPLTFLARLAALIPRPRAHLLTYHGVLAPAAAMRSEIVPDPPDQPNDHAQPPTVPSTGRHHLPYPARRRALSWAQLFYRAFHKDILDCPCGGRRALVALVTAPEVIDRILRHLDLGLSTPAGTATARAPPAHLAF